MSSTLSAKTTLAAKHVERVFHQLKWLAAITVAVSCFAQAPVHAQKEPPAPLDSPSADQTQADPAESDNAPGTPTVDSDATPSSKAAAGPRDDLSIEQGRLADRYKRLEEVMGRLAELSSGTDPRRAKLLREAIAKSREEDISVRFESVIKLLEQERLSNAATNQTELHKELDSLLTLLLKADRDQELASERERVRQYLKEVSRLIRLEKGLRARTEGGDDAKRLADDQKRVAEETGKLEKNIDENESEEGEEKPDAKSSDDESSDKEGKPSESDKSDKPPSGDDKSKPGDSKSGDQKEGDGQPKPGGEPKPNDPKNQDEKSSSPPSDSKPADSPPSKGEPSDSGKPSPAEGSPPPGQPGNPSPGESQNGEQPPSPPQQQPADRATENLRKAQQKMEDASKKLDEAKREGAAEAQKTALQELEQAKAELERILRQLREEEMERTLAQLAARFRKMLEAQTAVYEGTVRVDKVPEADRDHDEEIEAARLSREESLIAREADKAMLLLREEGSSVAFPEAVEQMREDMQTVTTRLAAAKVGAMTQGLEQDIIAALEETIAALDKAVKDLEKNRTPPGQPPSAGQQSEPPLVNKLAELKMIRSLQMRINERTKRYDQMIGGPQADTPELLEALDKLGERQERVVQATADLSQGRND
jgi:hypothetical protein